MLRNYLVLTLRNLTKNSIYSFINIAGLAIGIACSILILLWVDDEMSFDTFIPKKERLYQVWIHAEYDGKINSWRSVPLPTYEEMKVADANIVNSVVSGWGSNHLLKYEDTRLKRDGYFVSEEFLEMFEFPLISGSAETVLDDPYSIVLTESMAKALFKDEDPFGKMVRVDDANDLKVTGILKDIPENSSFQFDFLIPWSYRAIVQQWVRNNEDNWDNNSFQVFVELNDPKNAANVEDNIRNLLDEKSDSDFKREFFLHPLLSWRLHSNFENGKQVSGRADYVKLFTVIAIFILVIACINFMNLATARSEKRAREVGIRKSVGSRKWELVVQFLGESVLITTISFMVAILLVLAVLPFYNDLVEKELFPDFTSLQFWLFSLAVILLTGLLAGSYPAFYLSSFNPVQVLKGSVQVGKGAVTPRKVLVILQNGFAVVLIIGTIVIYKQIQLCQSRELGYDQENLISVQLNDEMAKNYDALKTELIQSGTAVSVTRTNSPITEVHSNNFLEWPGKPEEEKVMFVTIAGHYDWAKTMGVEVLQGREFSEEYAQDTAAIVVNKAGLEIMGLEDPIGTELTLWGSKRTLIGVVDNVLMGSVFSPIRPMMYVLDDWGGTVTVRLPKTHDLQAGIARVEAVFAKHNPAYPFDHTFVDEDFEKKFTTINLTSRLAGIFAVLAVIITGLGLFGLASFTAEQKTKEIGVRKVLGASVGSLIGLMSKEFSKLVLFAFFIAAPVGWWLLNEYLDRYTIRTNVEWWVFPVTGLVIMVFTLLIVANQALSAAKADPVKSLRSE